MDAPLGRAVGNALEIRECVETLAGHGPPDLLEVVEAIGVRVLRLAGRAPDDAAALAQLRAAITSGAGRRKLRDMVAAQGGDVAVIDDPARLPAAPLVQTIEAGADGVVAAIDAELIGQAAVRLGAGRERKGDPVDHAAGIVLRTTVGAAVRRGQPMLELHGADQTKMAAGRAVATRAVRIGGAVTVGPRVRAYVTPDGDVREP
jgi:pyrimidine-nucleoside phosphorylase